MAVVRAATATPEAMEAVRQSYYDDIYADSTRRSRDSNLSKWIEMHHEAHKFEECTPPPFPLTPDIVAKVAACFKVGGYLSFENYMLRAKAEHMSAGGLAGAWTYDLSTAQRHAVRSVGRHAGKSRQSQPIDPVRVAGMSLADDPLVAGGPLGSGDFIISGCFWLLREVEIAAARLSHITVHDDGAAVTWVLPNSKTDARALGTSRSWVCA